MTKDGKQTIHFARGAKIFHDGDPGGTAFIIESGKVEIHKEIDGERVILSVIGPHQIFGELATIDDAPRMASATAVEDTVCFVITEQNLRKRLESTDAFTQTLIRVLVRSVRSTATVLEDWKRRS